MGIAIIGTSLILCLTLLFFYSENILWRVREFLRRNDSPFSLSPDLEEVEKSLATLRYSLARVADTDYLNKADRLVRLAGTLNNRYELLGQVSDFELAIATAAEAASLVPQGHALHAAALGVSGMAFIYRYDRTGVKEHLSQAVHALERAAHEMPSDHAYAPTLYSSLGTALAKRFECIGALEDIDQAYTCMKQAIDLLPKRHPDLVGWLGNLANACILRAERGDSLEDISEAVDALQRALALADRNDLILKAQLSNTLGDALHIRFRRMSQRVDIDDAIEHLRNSVKPLPAGHPLLPIYCNNLGLAFRTRFERLEDIEDIYLSIAYGERALQLSSSGHPERAKWLSNLGSAYSRRYERVGDKDDLSTAIELLDRAVNMTPDSYIRIDFLCNLGGALRLRYTLDQNISDLETSVVFLRQALGSSPSPRDEAALQNNIALSLQALYDRHGHDEDIVAAIAAQSRALNLSPDGHIEKLGRMTNLAGMYATRYSQRGDTQDIDECVALLQRTVNATPDGHARKPIRLCNLGQAYRLRFETVGEPQDIEDAVSFLERAVSLTVAGQDLASCYHGLGAAYMLRFERTQARSDADTAVNCHRHAVEYTPDGHSMQAARLSSLGNSLRSLSSVTKDVRDIDEAIDVLRRAGDIVPIGHLHKPSLHLNLGLAHQRRFVMTQSPVDVGVCIEILSDTLSLTPAGHTLRGKVLTSLGRAYATRLKSSGKVHAGSQKDFDAAYDTYLLAAREIPSGPSFQLTAAINAAELAYQYGLHTPAMLAWEMAIPLLTQHAWLGQKLSTRYERVASVAGVVHIAVATALSGGELAKALMWIEEGRALVWGQMLWLRTPLDDLRERNPSLANELEYVSRALDAATTQGSSESVALPIIGNEIGSLAHADEKSQSQRTLARKYELLLQEVRKLKGFEHFLHTRPYKELLSVAQHGHVVIVNMHPSRCDALVVCPSGKLMSVPLPRFSHDLAEKCARNLSSVLSTAGVRDRASVPGSGTAGKVLDQFARVLSCLWLYLVRPILESLEDELWMTTRDRIPRITWCTTGPLMQLPVHAAGIYDPRGINSISISDFVVSSYTPNLASLLRKPRKSQSPSLLVVSQSQTPGASPLPGTVKESAIVARHFPHNVTPLMDESATVSAVRETLKEYNWVHLACHGVQAIEDPIRSAFLLHDGRLTLAQIMEQSLPNAELAVLSACQTATGDAKVLEESVHLAASMLTVGFPTVIGTLWSIGDADAPIIADAFYAALAWGYASEEVDQSRFAYALHDAVRILRDAVGVQNMVRWVPFVHFGI